MSKSPIKKVAMLFAGGPAPAANAVIGTAALAFLNDNIEVLGIKHGYSHLIDYDASKPLVAGEAYINICHRDLSHLRTSQGILIGTARTNPGKAVSAPEHLVDPERSAPLKRVYEALCLFRCRCADLDRWRRHLEDSQQNEAVPRYAARWFKEDAGNSSSEDN